MSIEKNNQIAIYVHDTHFGKSAMRCETVRPGGTVHIQYLNVFINTLYAVLSFELRCCLYFSLGPGKEFPLVLDTADSTDGFTCAYRPCWYAV